MQQFRMSKTSLHVTTSCYAMRVASLQNQLLNFIEEISLNNCSPERIDEIGREMKPLYQALWAIFSELEAIETDGCS